MNKNINVLSLFDGISTGLLALKELNYNTTYLSSEISEDAITVSKKNHPEIIHLGDVRNIYYENGYLYSKSSINGKLTINRHKIDIDLLIGGSPCQNLSSQNEKREGLKGEKSSLFYEYARLLKEINPKYFLLENVKMPNEDKNEISNILGVQPIFIDSRLLSAQVRGRLYWTNIPNVEQPEDKGIKLSNVIESGYVNREKSNCITESYSRQVATPGGIRRYMMGFGQLVFEDEKEYKSIVGETNEDRIEYSKKLRKLNGGKNLVKGIDVPHARMLTAKEVERLQTLPEDYTYIEDFYYSSRGYNKQRGENKRYSLCGEGWTKDVIVHILKNMEF